MEHIDFSKIFHQSSKDLGRGHPPIPTNSADWPDEWKTRYYKAYPRLPKIVLPDEKPQADFFDLIMQRHSGRRYDGQPLSLRELSALLRYSCGITGVAEDGLPRRAQASAGARYPIETYLVIFTSGQDLSAGVYHYDVKNHQLDVLWQHGFTAEEIANLFINEFVQNASAAIVLTSVFSRTQNKYGERGYRLILLEAGHIGQNIYLAAEALGWHCCALGGTRDVLVEALLDIDGSTESVVYSLALGK